MHTNNTKCILFLHKMSTEVDKKLILNEIKAFYKFKSDAQFADFLGIRRQTLSSWYTRNTFDIELLYAKCTKISPDFLFTGLGEVEKIVNNRKAVGIYVTEPETLHNRMPKVVTVDSNNRNNVVLVPVKAAAGYLNGYGDPEFIEKLPTYNLPNIQNGTYRMFQVNGHSMYPTMHNGSIVAGEFVENWVKDIKDDRVYIIISKTEGIIIKRCLNRIKKYGNIYCKSDNRKEYPSYALVPEDIAEVWEFKLYLGYELPNPADMYDRVNDLEADVEFLKSKLKLS